VSEGRAVVLDACVLFPVPLRDILLRAAEAGLYRPRWSAEILEEVRRNLQVPSRLTEQQTQRLIDAMRAHFPEAEVANYERHLDRLSNHPKDRHVLAAAVESGAPVIVTNNLRHFRRAALSPHGVEAQSPNRFLVDLFDEQPALLVQIVTEQAAALRNPTTTVTDLLDRLERSVPGFARRCAKALPREQDP
jgi:predicted nucleic acid-binding protein